MYPIGTDKLEALACMAHNLKLPVKPWLFWARYRAWRQDHREWCLINDRDSYLTVIAKYKRHFWDRINTDESFLELVLQIQDCDLVCCCAPLPCHGDVIKAWFDAGCPLKE